MIIAVDFDGTLCTNKYPQIGEPNKQLFQILINKQKAGDIIILNTCRHGVFLEQAIDFCKSNGLNFEYVNCNTEEGIAKFGDCRKIGADIYIDDKAISPAAYVELNRNIIDKTVTKGRQRNSRCRNTSLREQKAQKRKEQNNGKQ